MLNIGAKVKTVDTALPSYGSIFNEILTTHSSVKNLLWYCSLGFEMYDLTWI